MKTVQLANLGIVLIAIGAVAISMPTLGAGTQNNQNGELFGTAAYALDVDPSNPNTLYAAIRDGIVKSTDGGSSWTDPSPDSPTALITVSPVNSTLIVN